jgi:hypothetical protein
MTLNVNLEDVPWAILEAVRGRIMSNRRRLEESQQEQQRPALQPKPQFRKFGADGRTWKRPEPAAVASETIGILVAPPPAGYVNGKIKANSKLLRNVFFWNRNQVLSFGGNRTQELLNYKIAAGPVDATSSLHADKTPGISGLGSIGFSPSFYQGEAISSEFANNDSFGWNDLSKGLIHNSFYANPELSVRQVPNLIAPIARSKNYDAFTFEAIIKPGPPTTFSTSGFDISFYHSASDDSYTSVDIAGVNEMLSVIEYDVQSENSNYRLLKQPDTRIAVNRWTHFAFCKNKATGELSLYLNGVRVFHATAITDYWESYVNVYPEESGTEYSVIVGDLPIWFRVNTTAKIDRPGIDDEVPDASFIHGVRWTSRCLYNGPSFTPPTSITRLA